MTRRVIGLALLVRLSSALAGADLTVPEPLTLAEAHAAALRNHPRVQMAKLQGLIAGEVVKQNRAAYYPTANGYFDAVEAGNANTRLLAGAINSPSVFDKVGEGIAVSELLTDFGQTTNRVASARLAAKAEGEATAATDQQILLNVDVNYYNVLETRAVLQVARLTVAARDFLVKQVSALAQNQLKSDLDVSFAQVASAQAQLLLQKSENDAAGAEASLAAALGYRRPRDFQLADVPLPAAAPPGVETLIDRAVANRPDLLRLRYEREAARRLARAEKDRNYPTVEAIGMAGNALSHDARLPDKYAAGGIAVDIPLFTGGADLARQHAAEMRAQIADQTLRGQEDDVDRDVRLAWLNFNTAVQRLRTTEQLLQHTRQAFRLAQARYRLGGSSIVELSEAQEMATSAQIGAANARYDELMQRALLDYQVGDLR